MKSGRRASGSEKRSFAPLAMTVLLRFARNDSEECSFASLGMTVLLRFARNDSGE
jgi:hypothetical protein